ncbi:ABC transporter, integral membrane type 1 [Penicillium expansum]|nr:ABC transporter, integral membrane type 1 [Penicillium expansum]KGO59999.1 ABC transporter, integral membrane type 1 [Penicillium expansum]
MDSLCNDNSFGPIVRPSCRGGFDFTLLFENAILTILPCSLIIVLGLGRLFNLRNSPRKVGNQASFAYKAVAICLLALFQLTLLIVWVYQRLHGDRVTIPAATVELVATIVLALLSHAEHLKNVRPSTILTLYLPLVVTLDIARDRTLWLMHLHLPIAVLFTVCLALKVAWVVLEAREKRNIILDKYSDINSEESAGILKRSFFGWLLPYIIHGAKREIAVEDLVELDGNLRSRYLHEAFQREWHRGKSPALVDPRKPNQLALSLLKIFKWRLLAGVLPRIGLLVFTIFQPIVIQKLIDYVSATHLPMGDATGVGLIGAVLLVYGGTALCTGVYYHTMYRLVVMIRGALISAIYEGALASHGSNENASSTLTLISADCDTIVLGLVDFHEVWASFAQIGVIMWLLARQVQWGAAAPLVLSLACVFASVLLFGRLSLYQKDWNAAIQVRLAATADMLGQMREVKFLGLSGFFTAFIQGLRVKELCISHKLRTLLVCITVIALTPMTLAPVITFIIFVAPKSTGSLVPSTAFSSLTMLSLLSQPINLLVQTAPGIAGALGCLDRIQIFLAVTRKKTNDPSDSTQIGSFSDESELQPMKTLNVNTAPLMEYVLHMSNSNLGWKKDSFVVRDLCISVSPGQSVAITGPVAGGKTTILKGILGETISAQGLIDCHGSSIAYCDQVPWLMNATIRQNIAGDHVSGLQRYKKVIKACQLEEDFMNLPDGEQTLVGSNGMKLSHGQKQRISLARTLMKRVDLALIDDVLSGLDKRTKTNVFHRVFGPHGLLKEDGSSCLLVTHDQTFLSSFDKVVALNSDGTIDHQGPIENHQSNEQCSGTSKEPSSNFRDVSDIQIQPNQQIVSTPSQDRQNGSDWTLYKYYANVCGNWNSLMYLAITVVLAFAYNFSSLWLDWWSSADSGTKESTTVKYLTVYSILGATTLGLIAVASWQLIVRMVSKSALQLHLLVLQQTMRAPVSFFASTDTGVMMNRFSEDMQLFDMGLPMAALNTTIFFNISVIQLIIVCASTRWMATMIPFCIGALYLLQSLYLRTSRQVRIIDIELRAPLYTQFLETLSGLVTIRCFKWQEAFSAHHEGLLDTSQRAFYMLYTIQRWLNLVLDLLVMGLAVMLAVFAVALHGKMSPGSVGLAITNITTFNYNLVSVIQAWTKVEMSLGALVRTREFLKNTPAEPGVDTVADLPPRWPERGEIAIENLVASHGADSPITIKNVSLTIKSSQKVGICGRTGSGKSSLVFSLCRGMHSHSGRILIDGIDLATVPPEEIRSRISTITQDPLLVKGTVRFNLNLSRSHTDAALLSACEMVGLGEFIQAHGGIDTDLSTLALSPGQKQLFCLARLLLNPAQIIILDEITSNVDNETDLKMREIIDKNFQRQTIISIAHRLDSILSYDKIAVLDKGKLLEFDSPDVLLSQKSHFADLLHHSSRFEDEDYRLELFVYWTKAKSKRLAMKDDNLRLNAPFCVRVFQRPKSNRLFAPTGWVNRTTFWVTVYERSVKSLTPSPMVSTSSNIKVPDQHGYGEASSSTAINEPTNITGELYTSKNPSAQNNHTESLVGKDTKYDLENIASLANMPAGQYVLGLINWARNTMPLTEVSLATEAEILKMHLFHDLRKLTQSVEQNIAFWMLLGTAYPVAKFLMSCSPSNAYTKDDRAKILQATAAAINAVYILANNQYEAQDSNRPDYIDVLQEICRQHPDDEYLTSLVKCAIEQLPEAPEAEQDEQSKAGLAERKAYPPVNEDDTYDHCDLSVSDCEV